MTAFRTIAIPDYVHRTLKASAKARGMSMSELLAELVTSHCSIDESVASKVRELRLQFDDAGRELALVVRNEIVHLDRQEAMKLRDALLNATSKESGQRRSVFRVEQQLVQVFPRGRGVVVSIDAEEITIMTAIARDLIAELDERLGAQGGSA
jgi:hypothetical protein